jgi:two-component system, OmpR family, sensor histidine kinase KdpD
MRRFVHATCHGIAQEIFSGPHHKDWNRTWEVCQNGNVLGRHSMEPSDCNADDWEKVEPSWATMSHGIGRATGRLRVFFGYAPGVGKTYAMLEAASRAGASGRRVVVGHAELHGSADLEELMHDQDLLHTGPGSHDESRLQGFDVEAAVSRGADLILLDDLAHTNPSTSRHRKRWQDVEELLGAGIDVWTTLNVQDVESFNESVARITGAAARETVPDRFLHEASEITFIDLSPDELLDRIRDGKVHLPDRLAGDADMFFSKANLIALRELAMRCVTDRAGQDLQARSRDGRSCGWSTSERLLVYLQTGADSVKLIRAAQRMANAMRAEWIVVYPEAPLRKQDARNAELLNRNLRLSERLGAETVRVTGEDIVWEILDYAASRNVTRIVVGKGPRDRGVRFWRRSPADRLISESGDIDVYVIRSAEEAVPSSEATVRRFSTALHYGWAAGFVVLATGVASFFDWLGLTDANLVMTYLLAVVVSAVRLGRGPAILSSIAGVLLFNFFFTSPRLTFVVDKPEYIYTFAVMLAITLVVSALTARIRDQISLSREKERRTELLYRVSGRLAGIPGELQLIQAAKEELVSIFSGEMAFFLARDGELRIASREGVNAADWSEVFGAAKWVFEHRQMAGWGTDAIPDAQALYIPLSTPDATVGVLAWKPDDSEQLLSFERRQLLKVIAKQIALALERDRLAHESQTMLAQAEAEKLRSSLLSAVSHDLRSPLTSIAGSASILVERDLDADTRRELAKGISEEAERLNQLLESILQLTRLESGSLRIEKQWQPIDEVIGSALRRQERNLRGRQVDVALPDDAVWVPVDGLLIEQVMQNLLSNSAKYSPDASPIDIGVRGTRAGVEVSVADRGFGISADECERVFDRFYRGRRVQPDGARGAGLGLAISRGIILAHGGRIWAEPRSGGGTQFKFVLTTEGRRPSLDGGSEDAGEGKSDHAV